MTITESKLIPFADPKGWTFFVHLWQSDEETGRQIDFFASFEREESAAEFLRLGQLGGCKGKLSAHPNSYPYVIRDGVVSRQ